MPAWNALSRHHQIPFSSASNVIILIFVFIDVYDVRYDCSVVIYISRHILNGVINISCWGSCKQDIFSCRYEFHAGMSHVGSHVKAALVLVCPLCVWIRSNVFFNSRHEVPYRYYAQWDETRFSEKKNPVGRKIQENRTKGLQGAILRLLYCR